MKTTRTRTTTVTTESTYNFSSEEVLNALKIAGLLPSDTFNRDSIVFVRVPGGGDWSNTDLEIESSNPLVVKVKRVDRVDE